MDVSMPLQSPTTPLPKPAAKFAAVGLDVKQGRDLTVARATSTNFAKRIANALNHYAPNRRGQ